MRPKLEILSQEQARRVLDDAYHLLNTVGVKVQSQEARQLLGDSGAMVDKSGDVIKIPALVIEAALKTAPTSFQLFNRLGSAVISYGGDQVHFDPGSSGVHILDPETLEHRPSTSGDLARIIKVTEMLPQYDAQSTAVVCNEVPSAIGDLYRLFLVLLLSEKPVVTGSFSISGLDVMIEMLALFAGGRQQLAQQPRAVFDVCPTPPLVGIRLPKSNQTGKSRHSSRDGLHAASRCSLSGHAPGFHHTACSRKPGGDRDPPVSATGHPHRVGRSTGYLRYAQGRDTFRRY
jgi:trimethylamine--corrinoid protein Co-methyltransferase